MITRVKICCISNITEAKLAVQYGASALGLVGKMPSGPGIISDELILEITKTVPPAVSTFLLTSEIDSIQIINHHKKVNTNTIQLVDAVESDTYKKIREVLPYVKIVQVIHVKNEKSISEAEIISGHVDALLLDSGNPAAQIKILGGTGKIHNWEISKRIVENIQIPVFLAGGLNSDNVEKAIEFVQPFGLDICSGVRTDCKLDESKLSSFMEKVFKYY
jgi:phosphoribosylanthranilate isomerase